MGTELLVASLWGAVLVYWLWTRRPTTADTVGLFHRELRILEQTAPTRLPAANRLVPDGRSGVGGQVGQERYDVAQPAKRAAAGSRPVDAAMTYPVGVPALGPTRPELQRRRRGVLMVLVALVASSLLIAALTHSTASFAVQGLFDAALAGYLWLLASSAKARPVQRRPRRFASGGGRVQQSAPSAPLDDVIWADAPSASRERAYVPAHSRRASARELRTGPMSLGGPLRPGRPIAGRPSAGHPSAGHLGAAPSRPAAFGAHADAYADAGADGARSERSRGISVLEPYGDFDSYESLALVNAN